jgi:hypothetical protein
MLQRRMNSSLTKSPITVDRLATSDEIRVAMLPYLDPVEEFRTEILREIAADVGGYVRLSTGEIRSSLLVEELNQCQDADTN